MKKTKVNHITPAALKRLDTAVGEMGLVLFAEYLDDRGHTFCNMDGEASHISIAIVRPRRVDETQNRRGGSYDALDDDTLREVYARAGMAFKLEDMDNLTDTDSYNDMVKRGTNKPYYYHMAQGGHLCIAFKAA